MNDKNSLSRFSNRFVKEIVTTDAFTHNIIHQLMNGAGSFAVIEHILTDRMRIMEMFQVAIQFSDIRYNDTVKEGIDKINEKYKL